MAYRELRNFTEIMRALGYPRLISVENFRTPNFPLVAHILYWLVERYDPEIRVADVIDSENDRVEFVTSITQAMMSKARVRLNAKKLYGADGYAVKELLKIATVLYSALRSNEMKGEEEEAEVAGLSTRAQDVKVARTLATEITEKGARLYDLLGQEVKMQSSRSKALRFLDSISSNLQSTSEYEYIERSIRDSVSGVQHNIEALKKQCVELDADEKALESKIKKKQTDLERNEKRLKSLQTVRPAFMDEYERLEKELQRQYEVYLARFRNIEYLEHELDLYHISEKEKLEHSERQLKKMQKRLREEELKLLRGEQDMKEDDADANFVSKTSSSKPNGRAAVKQANGHAGNGRGTKAAAGGGTTTHVQGSLAARGSEGSAPDMSDRDEASSGGGSEGLSEGSDDVGSESGSDLIDDQDGSDELSDEGGDSPGFDEASNGSEEDF